MSLNSLRVMKISEEHGTKVIANMGRWYGGVGFFVLPHSVFEHISKM